MGTYDRSIPDDVSVQINGTNVDSKVIRYRRDLGICSGVGNLELVMHNDGSSFDPWDVVRITEGGSLAGIFYVVVISKSSRDGTVNLKCQDGSKKLTDYFIPDSYTITEPSNSGYWIDKFLDEAGVSHTISGNGVQLSENTQLGLTSAYDAITQLCQYSGWYFYFDGDGKCIVGPLNARSRSYTTFETDRILSIRNVKHDTMLRNRAVVWGNANPLTGEQVWADISTRTPWNYDANDVRTVVLSNHLIYTPADAEMVARRIINEFSRINYEKEVSVAGVYPITVSDFVRVHSKVYTGTGMVTTVNVDVSSNGMTSNYILDERCPRMFAFWGDFPEEYVYVGTLGSGVYRKVLWEYQWEPFSSGLLPESMNVIDLYVQSDNFACVSDDGLSYYRTPSSNWSQLVPSGVYLPSGTDMISPENLTAEACTINAFTGRSVIGYNYIGDTGSAVVEYNGTTFTSYANVYVPSGDAKFYNVELYDIDTTDRNNILSVSLLNIPVEGAFDTYNTKGTDTRLFIANPNYYQTIFPDGGNVAIGTSDGGVGFVPSGSYNYKKQFFPEQYYDVVPYRWYIEENLTAFIGKGGTGVTGDSLGVIWSGTTSEINIEIMTELPSVEYLHYAGNRVFNFIGTSGTYLKGYSYNLDTESYTEELSIDLNPYTSANTAIECYSDNIYCVANYTTNGYPKIVAVNLADFTYVEKEYAGEDYPNHYSWNKAIFPTKDDIYFVLVTMDKEEIPYENSNCDEPCEEGSITTNRMHYNCTVRFTTVKINKADLGLTLVQTPIREFEAQDLFNFNYTNFANGAYSQYFSESNYHDYVYYNDGYVIGYNHDTSYVKVRFLISYIAWDRFEIGCNEFWDDPIHCWYEDGTNEWPTYYNLVVDYELPTYAVNEVYEEAHERDYEINYQDESEWILLRTIPEEHFLFNDTDITHSAIPLASYTPYQTITNNGQAIYLITNNAFAPPGISQVALGIDEHLHCIWPMTDFNNNDIFMLVADTTGHPSTDGDLRFMMFDYPYFENKAEFDTLIHTEGDTQLFMFNQKGIIYGTDTDQAQFIIYFAFENPSNIDPTLDREGFGVHYYVLKQTNEDFEVIYEGGRRKVEVSNQYPTVAYVLPSGSFYTGDAVHSFSATLGDFQELNTSVNYYDVRTTRIISASGIPVTSGSLGNINGQYHIVANGDNVFALPTNDPTGGVILTSFSGVINHVEATNNIPTPYLFASASGEFSVDKFYQFGPVNPFWSLQTTGLPDKRITIIRVDDRI